MTAPATGSEKRGHFTVIDVPTFRHVCMKSDADTAAVYLAIVMGTDRSGLTGSWGREAIRRRLSMSWRRVDRCVNLLEEMRVISWPQKSQRKVRILLTPIEIRPMREGYRAAIDRAREGKASTSERMMRADHQAELDGWLDKDGAVIEARPIVPAYLPLSLIGDAKGMPTDGPCFIERIRKARDPMAFLLLVQMYAAHDLLDIGGVAQDFAWLEFAKEETVWKDASHKVLQASDRGQWTRRSDLTKDHRSNNSQEDIDAYFHRVAILRDAGVLEFLLAVVEDNSRDAQIITPLGVMRHGKLLDTEPEHNVGMLAIAASLAMNGDGSILNEWLDYAGQGWLVPVDRMYRKATIRGIPRLVARPKTRNSQQWQSERIEACRRWADTFRGIILERSPEMLEPCGRLQCDLNETSKRPQRDINDILRSSKHTSDRDAVALDSDLRRNAS